MKYCEKCSAEMSDAQQICGQCGWKPLLPVEQIHGVVPLADEFWAQLKTAYGNGIDVLHWIRRMESASTDEISSSLSSIDYWGYLDHQTTVYDASFAAVPHLVRIAGKLPPQASTRFDLLILVGAIAGDGGVSLADANKSDWRAGFMPASVDAFRHALRLIYESLSTIPDESTTRWFMAATAAICGHETLWHKLQWLDAPVITCPKCGEGIARPDDT
jgi:hypothetical protein